MMTIFTLIAVRLRVLYSPSALTMCGILKEEEFFFFLPLHKRLISFSPEYTWGTIHVVSTRQKRLVLCSTEVKIRGHDIIFIYRRSNNVVMERT